jgi:hypothetical protein
MSAFDEHVRARLAAGAVEYGQRSYNRPLAGLLAEILEEAADIGGWSHIALDVLNRDGTLTPDQANGIRLVLRGAENRAQDTYHQVSARLLELITTGRGATTLDREHPCAIEGGRGPRCEKQCPSCPTFQERR